MVADILSACKRGGCVLDSRKATPGSVLFALEGEHVDGHDFVDDALERGAQLAVVKKGRGVFGRCIEVEDVRATLQEAAKAYVREVGMRIIGVTGSSGKTTTKEYIAAVLATRFVVEKSAGNSNSQVGLPAAILNMKAGADWYVMEMGMSQKGEMARLVEMAPPELSVVTMIGRAHIEFFSSEEEIAYEKYELLRCPSVQHAFIGEEQVVEAIGACVKHYVSFEKNDCLSFLPPHNQRNAELALAVGRFLSCDQNEMIEAIRLVSDSKRADVRTLDGITWINDSYNASPEGMRAALQMIATHSGRRGALLGEMKELGERSEAIHKEIASDAVESLDYLLCFGHSMKAFQELFAKECKPVFWFASKEEAQKALHKLVSKGDTVLVKGANSYKLWESIPC